MPLPPRQSQALDLEIAAGKLLPGIYDRSEWWEYSHYVTDWRIVTFPKKLDSESPGKRLQIKSP